MKSGKVRVTDKNHNVLHSKVYNGLRHREEIIFNWSEVLAERKVNKYYIIIAPILPEDEIEIYK